VPGLFPGNGKKRTNKAETQKPNQKGEEGTVGKDSQKRREAVEKLRQKTRATGGCSGGMREIQREADRRDVN
jgi:hypothetical protein